MPQPGPDAPPRPAAPRPIGAVTVAGVVLFVLTVSWFVIGLGHVWSLPGLGWLPMPPMAVLGAYACWRTARRAERNGTIVELGRWILREVVRQAAEWERAYGLAAPEKVSINISARQLREPGFAAEVGELLLESGIDPHRLVAEVTETAVLGTGEALDAVHALHKLGMRVALDDFGTGQSSLSLLVDTPVRVLKVDKSFVDGVTAGSSQAVIGRSDRHHRRAADRGGRRGRRDRGPGTTSLRGGVSVRAGLPLLAPDGSRRHRAAARRAAGCHGAG
jgi:hypothetical protein